MQRLIFVLSIICLLAGPALAQDGPTARELLDGRRAARRIRIDALDEEDARELEDIRLGVELEPDPGAR